MKLSGARPALAAALLLSGLWMPQAYAHAGGGAHGGGHGGGGHAYAGGHAGGFGGHAGGAHAGGGFTAQRVAPRGAVTGARPAAFAAVARAPAAYGRGAVAARGAIGAAGFRGAGYGVGYGRGRWGGGYWGGRFWPGVYYGAGFAWFLPTLPLYCATFWFNSVPYYYYNDVYYTWSPTADGYVATDPPPALASTPSAPAANPASYPGGYDGAAAGGQSPPPDSAPAPESAPEPIPPGAFSNGNGRGSDTVFAYPSNGQSEQQQAADRAQCAQWAASQTGGASGSADYRRAQIACFQGRGYAAQ